MLGFVFSILSIIFALLLPLSPFRNSDQPLDHSGHTSPLPTLDCFEGLFLLYGRIDNTHTPLTYEPYTCGVRSELVLLFVAVAALGTFAGLRLDGRCFTVSR